MLQNCLWKMLVNQESFNVYGFCNCLIILKFRKLRDAKRKNADLKVYAKVVVVKLRKPIWDKKN